jgi:hypothetical protein
VRCHRGSASLIAVLLYVHCRPDSRFTLRLALPQLWTAFKHANVLASEYYCAPPEIRLIYAAQYLILAGLAVIAFETYEELKINSF